MNPIVVAYVGLTVVLLVLVWEGFQYYERSKHKASKQDIQNWTTYNPHVFEQSLRLDNEDEEDELSDRRKEQQNGHYTERKRIQ